MKGAYLSMDDAYKIANFDKLKEENTMLKSDNNILKEAVRNKDKQYLKMIEERDKEIKKLKEELYNFLDYILDKVEDCYKEEVKQSIERFQKESVK